MEVDPVGPYVDPFDQGGEDSALAGHGGNAGQCLPISVARATRRYCNDGSASRAAVDLSMLPGSRSHRCTRSLTSCSISAAGIRSAAAFSVRSFVISEPET